MVDQIVTYMEASFPFFSGLDSGSGSGQCSRYSVGFPCFSHHRLHLSVSQYIADDTHGQFYHRTLFISVKLHPRLIPHYASYYGPL